jgi:2-methylisocitrate lyase-like PEP mutase family enzyme
VPSVRIYENEGFQAVATSNAGMLVSLGYPDGEVIPYREFVSAVSKISHVLSIPRRRRRQWIRVQPRRVARSVKAAIAAGAVAINFENFIQGIGA